MSTIEQSVPEKYNTSSEKYDTSAELKITIERGSNRITRDVDLGADP